MKTYLKVTLLLIVYLGTFNSLHAQENRYAIGAQLLGPSGVTGKLELNSTTSVTGLATFRIQDGNSSFFLQANLIFSAARDDMEIESGRLTPYYGVGLEADFNELYSNFYSIRGPLGLEYEFESNPLGVYLDIAPTLDVEPNVALYIGSSLGVRYYFN